MPEPITAPHLLFVEGKEDSFFFQALIRHLDLENTASSSIQIIIMEGKYGLRDKLVATTKTPGFEQVTTLAIVRDADCNPDGAFSSVCDALTNASLSRPSTPMTCAGSNPSVSVMILPLPYPTSGTLEDICLEAVNNEMAMSCVRDYFQCLNNGGITVFQNQSKSKIHAYLASKPEVKRLGEAALAGYLPWDAQPFQPIIQFLERLIGIP